ELARNVKYFSGSSLYLLMFADWRDTLQCNISDEQFDPQEIPLVCRYVHPLKSSAISGKDVFLG
ncbi:hypothetical protein PSY31_23800, partial [Shigella flexneri]|nr:hypothetical protein [Shigella flexneri]